MNAERTGRVGRIKGEAPGRLLSWEARPILVQLHAQGERIGPAVDRVTDANEKVVPTTRACWSPEI